MSSIVGLDELEELRLFLEERAQAFDETIDTGVGSTFDLVVIQPLIERLGPDAYNTPIRTFALDRLTKEFPDLVVQDGEPIDDLVIKPMQVLLDPYRRQIRQISHNQSIANPDILNETEADNLGANFFVRRRLGGYAVGIARLYFTAPQYALVTPSNPVKTSGGTRFYPVENQAITADRMLFNAEDNLFYFDIVVRAESQGAVGNIDPNQLVGIEGLSSVVKVTNKSSFEEGADKEDTTAFLERVEASLTEKSLVTVRGINARLTDVFEQIRLIQVIGFGDPEMNRDIITGSSESKDYAWFTATTPSTGGNGTPRLLLDLTGSGYIVDGNPAHDDFTSIRVSVGDVVTYVDAVTQETTEYTVTDVVDGGELRVTPNMDDGLAQSLYTIRNADGVITLSGIPGGIVEPTTSAGTIEVNDGEVHIGGALDVFVRAGDPQERSITLEGILDANPLHFGLDLESFGDGVSERAHITERSSFGQVAFPNVDRFGVTLGGTYNELVIRHFDEISYGGGAIDGQPTVPWRPTEEDVGRIIQLLGPTNWGSYEITEIVSEEIFNTGILERATRVKVDHVTDLETGAAAAAFTPSLSFDGIFRILENVEITDRVRDRDGSTEAIPENIPNPPGTDIEIPGGVDFFSLPGGVVEIGDSVIIETGDDAGIYSIRRVLSWLHDNDTLILDRALTKTVIPLGDGSGTGLRYRIADELNVDLVAPKVVKIPLGSVFAGEDLSTVAGSTSVTVTGTTDFLLAGVEEGDTLEILEGDNAGRYAISSVASASLELESAPISTGFAQPFSVYLAFTGVTRPLVRVKNVELLDSNSQPTGISIPYGDAIDARILGQLGNRARGNVVERFTGELQDNGAGIVDLYDSNVDFVAEGVETSMRLNILSGNSAESYTVIGIGAQDNLPSDNHIRVAAADDGGIAFRTEQQQVHYSIGEPSAGFLRLYFLEPTTVEIETGLSGGRLSYTPEGGTASQFRFSEVSGFPVIPAGASDEDNPRDMRMVRSYMEPLSGVGASDGDTGGGGGGFIFTSATGGFVTAGVQANHYLRIIGGVNEGEYDIASVTDDNTLVIADPVTGFPAGQSGETYEIVFYKSIVEVTDDTRPGVYELEIQEGDVVQVNEELPIRIAGGYTFQERGLYGTHAGLRTVSGSSRVTVPDNSLIDFTEMDTAFPLAGQKLFIDSGPDAGEYTIEEVVSDKSLRLDRVMTSTTATVLAADLATPRSAVLEDSTAKSNLYEADSNDASTLLFGAQTGHFITIFESTRADLEGTYEISDLLDGDPNRVEIDTKDELVSEGSTWGMLDAYTMGRFSWIRTSTDTNISQTFRIYRQVVTELEITQVATKREDVTGVLRGDINTTTQITDVHGTNFENAKRGDLLEILAGGARGTYTLDSDAAANVATIHANPSFAVTGNDVPFRVWGGLHGSRRMLTLGPKDSSSGNFTFGVDQPYSLLRPRVVRVSSTEMENFVENGLYYVDIQIESQGAGDSLNLPAGERLVVESGMKADGYTYSTQNENLSYSLFEEVSINFDRRFLPLGNSDSPENLTEVSGRNLSVEYESSTTVRLVNDLIRSDTDRPVNANPIARHFLPSFLLVNMSYAGGATVEEVGSDMEDYINSLGAEAEINISDLEGILVRRGATFIRHPISLISVTHDLGRKLVVDRSDNTLGGLNTTPFNGTGRISAFFTTYGETLILVRES
jgi:hypothetical protein